MVQIDVVRTFGDGEGPPWKHSLFGNPGDADTVKYNHFLIIYYLVFWNFSTSQNMQLWKDIY